MLYTLTEEEFEKLNNKPDEKEVRLLKEIIEALRNKILKDNNFKCPNKGISNEQEDGYCDNCPLSYCKNEDAGPAVWFYLCEYGSDMTYYSK
jgi:hypothetical protein